MQVYNNLSQCTAVLQSTRLSCVQLGSFFTHTWVWLPGWALWHDLCVVWFYSVFKVMACMGSGITVWPVDMAA